VENVFLFVVITCICLGHTHVLFVHLKKKNTKIKFASF